MRNLIVFAATTAMLTGCVEATSDLKPGAPYRLSASNVSVVKRDVRASMKDPDSARFGSMAASIDEKGVVTVCGYVNGKNSFGGYVGEKPFFGVLTTQNTQFYVGGIAGSDTDVRATIITCQKAGVAI